jgi:hypothetical protein
LLAKGLQWYTPLDEAPCRKAIFRREGAPRRWWNNWFGTYALAAVVAIGMLLMADDPWSPNGRHDPD